jgi:hypothetical protein
MAIHILVPRPAPANHRLAAGRKRPRKGQKPCPQRVMKPGAPTQK